MDPIHSYYQLRRALGLLGIFLPLALYLINGLNLENSISHYYFTDAGVIFTGTMVSLGLFLVFYKGPEDNESIISDNALTSIAGLAAILVAIFPTGCDETVVCQGPLSDISNKTSNIHFGAAAAFISLMGWMSFFRFTRGDKSKLNKRRHVFYKGVGIVIWIVVVTLGVLSIPSLEIEKPDNYIYLGEIVALELFGVSWLIKGDGLINMNI